jgi:hypothetical protein
MNKYAAAMAADTALTVGDQKVFHTAEKVFALSQHHPVGVMTYGNAEFMGVPWETLIKVYRTKLGQRSFDTLDHYANDFIRFLEERNTLFPPTAEDAHVKRAARNLFTKIADEIEERILSLETDEPLETSIEETVNAETAEWESCNNLPGMPPNYAQELLSRYGPSVQIELNEVFEEYPLTAVKNRLKHLFCLMFSKDHFSLGLGSGVVVVGYGDVEPFPCVVSFDIEAIVNNRLKYVRRDHDRISLEEDASILPFAEREMVDTFIVGIAPQYRRHQQKQTQRLLSEYRDRLLKELPKSSSIKEEELSRRWTAIGDKMLDDLQEQLHNYRREHYSNQVLGAVSALPKHELAAMAEALVSLTTFRQRVSLTPETVGGSVDVAVISKGDGFVWVKRNEYFKPELNPHLYMSMRRV